MKAISAVPKPDCPRCKQAKPIRYGFVLGRQRWFCRACAYQFTVEHLMFKPLEVKQRAAALYESGISSNRVGKTLGLSPTTVLLWARLLTPPEGRIHAMVPKLCFPRAIRQELQALKSEGLQCALQASFYPKSHP
jgi:transposase-like protein